MKVVREKYLNQVCPEDQDKFQHFLSDLYVFLVDNMHVGLRKVHTCMSHAYHMHVTLLRACRCFPLKAQLPPWPVR